MLGADVVVIGSGHAGIEAALSAARLGCDTLLLTQNLDTIGQMSCNPAVGGSGKSHIVREIDVLGGAMAVNADATGIQFRTLNRSKGPAVWATRVQCDKKAYQLRLKALVERTPRLRLLQCTATRVVCGDGVVTGVEVDLGVEISAKAVVITAGTFLRGLLHVGEQSSAGGRMADRASSLLSDSVRALGIESRRFKTGTPCRLNLRSVDTNLLELQRGDEPPPRLSRAAIARDRDDLFTLNFDETGLFHVEQLPCWITRTTPQTHEIIARNLHRSPLHQRRIEGRGPRYCPSIEDKIVRFSDRDSHHVFLEPEGRHSNEIYVNGVSTSLPFDVQVELIHSIPGLEQAEIIRPGYAVEYDYFPPTQLSPTLESKRVAGLFFAGQVNGTSGYEEAAGQGLVAGANAALRVLARPPVILPRTSSYLGVLIDDLTTRGTDEPYRMFTSRADDRLSLREDNAELRLGNVAAAAGLADSEAAKRAEDLRVKCRALRDAARRIVVGSVRLDALMRRPQFNPAELPSDIRGIAEILEWNVVANDMRYEGYIARQMSARPGHDAAIPITLDFRSVPGLRNETREKLTSARPASIAAARQLAGITAADLAVLSIWLHKHSR